MLLARRRANAERLVDTLEVLNDNGLMSECLRCWEDFCSEERHEREATAVLQRTRGDLLSFTGRNRAAAGAALGRASDSLQQLLLLRIFAEWGSGIRMCKTYNLHVGRLHARQKQVGKVQSMFREFASQLEDGLQRSLQAEVQLQPQSQPDGGGSGSDYDSADELTPTYAVHAERQRGIGGGGGGGSIAPRKQLSKSEHSVSLPSIHAGGPTPSAAQRRGLFLPEERRHDSYGGGAGGRQQGRR